MTSQWNSSSDNVPSGWLCRLVNGASMKRFFIEGPCAKFRGSKKPVISELEWRFRPTFLTSDYLRQTLRTLGPPSTSWDSGTGQSPNATGECAQLNDRGAHNHG